MSSCSRTTHTVSQLEEIDSKPRAPFDPGKEGVPLHRRRPPRALRPEPPPGVHLQQRLDQRPRPLARRLRRAVVREVVREDSLEREVLRRPPERGAPNLPRGRTNTQTAPGGASSARACVTAVKAGGEGLRTRHWKRTQPSAHQSAAKLIFVSTIISGGMYSAVPTLRPRPRRRLGRSWGSGAAAPSGPPACRNVESTVLYTLQLTGQWLPPPLHAIRRGLR